MGGGRQRGDTASHPVSVPSTHHPIRRKASWVVGVSVMTLLVILCLYPQLITLYVVTPREVFASLTQRWESVVLGNASMTSVPFIPQYLKELNQTQQEQKGDSNMPYPSDTIVRIRKPPPSVFTEPPHGAVNDTHLKKILFWNDDHFSKHFGFGFGRDPFLLAGCRVNNCTTTGDRTRYPLEQIDALIWHFRSKDRSLPKKRSPHTRYVFWMQESPSYLYGNLRNYRNVFNWTFTYRRDSDIVNPYALVFRRRKPLPPDHRDYAAGKTKLAAWFVSHCGTESGRESLVMSLKKRLSVDVYGYCGPLKCDKKNTGDCYNMLNKTYKFYFSFENSLCQEYITEKFFNILKLDVVPVVFGLGDYAVQAPPHSYIDALSFPSTNALADYLLYLNHNNTAYNEYFRWKRFHQVIDGWAMVSQQYCALCEMLHNDTPTKTYDLQKWYAEGGHCKTRKSPDIKRFINQ